MTIAVPRNWVNKWQTQVVKVPSNGLKSNDVSLQRINLPAFQKEIDALLDHAINQKKYDDALRNQADGDSFRDFPQSNTRSVHAIKQKEGSTKTFDFSTVLERVSPNVIDSMGC